MNALCGSLRSETVGRISALQVCGVGRLSLDNAPHPTNGLQPDCKEKGVSALQNP